MTRPQAVPTVQINDDRVIVTEWRFAPGAETGWHRHGHDYVVVPMTHGELLLETPDRQPHRATGHGPVLQPPDGRGTQRDQQHRP